MSDDVLFEVRGQLGEIALNRPKAMNALNLDIVQQIHRQLRRWKDDDAVTQVLIRGRGDKGLCAGGDIRAIYEDIQSQRESGGQQYATAQFLAAEFRLNLEISQFPKPYIAFMDGATLGGGIGVSSHGSHRIVTERTKAGMPETNIGYFPDVGGTYLLSRSPGRTGVHAGLTGGVFNAADTIHLDLADVFVVSEQLDDLAAALESAPVDQVLPEFTQSPPASELAAQREWIDDAYTATTVEEILERLGQWGTRHEAAAAARTTILRKSPTSIKLTLHGIRAAVEMDLAQAMQAEYAAAVRHLDGNDFLEGIRAQVIDKDRNPHWQPVGLDEVSDTEIATSFIPDERSALDLTAPPQEAHS